MIPKHFFFLRRKVPMMNSRKTFLRQCGFGLVESLIAVAILGSTVFMLLGSLTTGSLSIGILYEETISENIGRMQMEYTKSLAFHTAPYSYQPVTEIPDDYSVTATASPITGRDSNIQKITVVVYRNGKRIHTLEGYKVNR
jgi:prepilin-type N-terminal cleavage/methylation domain-containing protein